MTMLTPSDLSVATKAVESLLSRLRRHAARSGVDLWDLRQAGMLAAIQAHRNYDPARAAWITHLYAPVRFAMLRELLRLGSPVTLRRDDYAAGGGLRSVELPEEISSHPHESVVSVLHRAIECRALVLRMEALAGEEGARILIAVLLGMLTLDEAAELAGMTPSDIRAFRDWMLTEIRKPP